MYRPPDCPSNLFEEAIHEIKIAVENHNTTFPTTIITGDFNFPKTNWSTNVVSEARQQDQEQAKSLMKLTSDLLCTQIIEQPTRNNNILDLFFTNNHEIVREYTVENTVASDHNAINVQTNLNCKPSEIHSNKDLFFQKLNFNHKKNPSI